VYIYVVSEHTTDESVSFIVLTLQHYTCNSDEVPGLFLAVCRPHHLHRKSSRYSRSNMDRIDNTRHRVVTYLLFHIQICFYAVNVNRRVIVCRHTLHCAVSLRQHGFFVFAWAAGYMAHKHTLWRYRHTNYHIHNHTPKKKYTKTVNLK